MMKIKQSMSLLVWILLKDTHYLNNLFIKKSADNVNYHSFQAIENLIIEEVRDWTISDVAKDFKYVQVSISCNICIICVADRYTEFMNQHSGDLDYDYSQDFERLESNYVISASIKLEGEHFSDLQVQSVEFTA